MVPSLIWPDIIVAAPHAATQEFNGVNPSDVVVYELDTPSVSDLVALLTVAEQASQSLASLFTASNPLASQAITAWQVYDTSSNFSITVGGGIQFSGFTLGPPWSDQTMKVPSALIISSLLA